MPFARKANTPNSAIGRFLTILSVFDQDKPCLTLSEISRLTGLPATTTFRLLAQMNEWGALIRTDDRRYWIGPRFVELAKLAPEPQLLAAH